MSLLQQKQKRGSSDPECWAKQIVVCLFMDLLPRQHFNINPTSGLLEFNIAPDFEAPVDIGSDNVYTVEVTASDVDGRTDSQVLSITVDDMAVSIAGQQTNAFSGSSVTLSHETSGDNRFMLVTVAMANHGNAIVNRMSITIKYGS